MTYLYELEISGRFAYSYDPDNRFYFSRVLTVVASDVEQAKDKVVKRYYKYVEGAESRFDIILTEVVILNAVKKQTVDIY